MKKILFLLFSVAVLFSCKDPIADKGVLDPNAMITIRPAKGVQLRSAVTGLTALEIVQQAKYLKFQSHYFDNAHYETPKILYRGLLDEHKDYNNPAIKMLGIDIIDQYGSYYRDFTHSFNVVLTTEDGDTIATVPDNVINTVRPLIETAYQDENYTEVYRLFDEAFTFLPISE